MEIPPIYSIANVLRILSNHTSSEIHLQIITTPHRSLLVYITGGTVHSVTVKRGRASFGADRVLRVYFTGKYWGKTNRMRKTVLTICTILGRDVLLITYIYILVNSFFSKIPSDLPLTRSIINQGVSTIFFPQNGSQST